MPSSGWKFSLNLRFGIRHINQRLSAIAGTSEITSVECLGDV